MVSRLNDRDLCRRAWGILKERLGPVEALRFLSMVRTQPRDYLAWRDAHFRDGTIAELLTQIQEHATQGESNAPDRS